MNSFFSGNTYSFQECDDCNSIMMRCVNDVCIHKDLFPLNYSDVFLALLIFGTTTLSTLSGVGGGAIDVLILMLVGDFPLDMAVPLALCDVFGACIVKFSYFVKRRNPLNNFRYLPNYKIVLLFVPLYGTFAYIGYLLNAYSPYFLTLLVLFLVLCVSLYKSLVKLIVLYRKSSASYIKERAEIDGIYDVLVEKESLVFEEEVTLYMDYAQVKVSKYDFQLYSIKRRREKLFGLLFVNSLCMALNLVLLFFTLLKLIDAFLFFGIQLLFILCIVFFVVCYIYLDRHVGDTIIWSWFNVLKLIVASCVTGVVSSYVGVGGGMIMNPILVSMKVSPHVVLATYSVSAFYSVTIAIFQYIILGNVSLFYACLFFFSGISGALCGVLLLHFMNSQKAIVWCMVFLFLLSILMVFVSFLMELQDLQEIGWDIGVLSS